MDFGDISSSMKIHVRYFLPSHGCVVMNSSIQITVEVHFAVKLFLEQDGDSIHKWNFCVVRSSNTPYSLTIISQHFSFSENVNFCTVSVTCSNSLLKFSGF